jgi:hypothetical protein
LTKNIKYVFIFLEIKAHCFGSKRIQTSTNEYMTTWLQQMMDNINPVDLSRRLPNNKTLDLTTGDIVIGTLTEW